MCVFVSSKRSDVRRVWQLHESLLGHRLPDLEKPLHHLLLAAAKSHHFVKSSEGIRFASALPFHMIYYY